jgi:CRP-like cAMP-binding protein
MNKLFAAQSDHPLFRYFTSEERDLFEALGRVEQIREGEFLIRENERDSRLYSVEEGHLDVVINRQGKPAVVATVGPGEILGEVAFIDESPRSVSVKAGENSVVRVWDRATLLNALSEEQHLLSKFAVAMSELLVERLRDAVRRAGTFRPV